MPESVERIREEVNCFQPFRILAKDSLRYMPQVIITDKLKSYSAAKVEIMPGVEHRQHKGLNNRPENSHQPTRVREKVMRRFKSAGQARALPLGLQPYLITLPTTQTSADGWALP